MPRIAIHPGEHLAEELDALRTSAAELARRLKVPTNRVTEILNGQRAITGDTALRLAHFFGTSAEFWLNLQSLYELRVAEAKTGKAIKKLPTLKHLEEAHVEGNGGERRAPPRPSRHPGQRVASLVQANDCSHYPRLARVHVALRRPIVLVAREPLRHDRVAGILDVP